MRQTRGTETSYYPEEEKANAISRVAASETGRAQTKELALWGCRTLLSSYKGIFQQKRSGKIRHRRKQPCTRQNILSGVYPEYGGTREIPSESGRTISQG